MKKAIVFPGQGSQFVGMGQDLYMQYDKAKQMFHKANDILGFSITDTMFTGTDESLKATNITQPAIFLHSVIKFQLFNEFSPDMVAGHSLGEFSALVANQCIHWEHGLKLVSLRANAMQKACEETPSTMAAVLGLEDDKVVEICNQITSNIVVAANFNCPGQLVISGDVEGINIACEMLKAAGAKRALVLPVGGAFHSPLMESAKKELENAIRQTTFNSPICPIYQNVSTKAESNPDIIKENLITQLTAPVKWTQSIEQMIADGASDFYECGPGNVLQGLIKKINKEANTHAIILGMGQNQIPV